MELKLPERTARVVDWHDGVTLWVKTLNVWERDEAAEAADVWAADQVRTYRPGGDGYLILQERFNAMLPEQVTSFLAESGLLDGSFVAEAQERWPGDERSMVGAREVWLRDSYDRARQAASLLFAADAVQRCCAEAIRRRERNLRGFRLVCETLLRAVRLERGGDTRSPIENDHRCRYWSDIKDVMELADEERDFFWKLYEEMQLPASSVPTWAAVSLP